MSGIVPRDPGSGERRDLPFEFVHSEDPAGRGHRAPPGGHGHGPAPPDDTIELREVIRILRRRIWLVVLCIVLGGGAAWAISEFQAPIYRAQVVIRVDDPRAQMGDGLALLGQGTSRGSTDPVLSAMQVLRSHGVLGQLVDQEGLRLQPLDGGLTRRHLGGIQVSEFALPDTFEVHFESQDIEVRSARTSQVQRVALGSPVTFGEVRFSLLERPEGNGNTARLIVADRQRAIRWVERNLSARARPETNVVDVEFTASDPELAQRIVNQAVGVFQARSTAEARRETQRRRTFLEEQLAQADTTLQLVQQELSAFRSREQVASSEARASAQQTGLMSIEMRREELAADRNSYRTLLEGLRSEENDDTARRLQAIAASPEVAQNPIVSTMFAQLLEYETEREALTSGPGALSERNPDVARLDQQIATTRGRLEESIRSHMDAVDARISALDGLRNQTAAQVAAMPQSEAEEARLIQQVGSIQRTVEQLRDEFYRAQIAEAVEEGPIQLVDPAPLPFESERAGLPLMLALGLMLGAMVGSGGAFLLEMMNTTVRRREDLEEALRVEMVGAIPKLPRRGVKVLPAGRKAKGSALAAATNGHPPSNELITLHDNRSVQAESFRTLRTNLLFQKNGERVRSVVVTSAVPGEGKTTTAANLAVTYAQQGLKVLLVDCDLRKPRVNELFRIDRKPGMSELVLGLVSPEEAIRAYHPVDGLHLLPAGQVPPNPTELLGGNRTREVVNTLREEFEMVILDTPPLAGGADAAILGAVADGVLMVVRAGATDRDQVRQAGRQLHTVGAHLIGAVMNDPEGEGERYGSYYYQYDYYGGDPE